ncbi:unnamed protein product [Acanthoscelides obtectus]|uniref:DRBM domain-containing protein n=1 Tax=Acanthoscelides obtectus TaxID=200917 RepID=A0A9P0KQA1_ACAOB|nr:unnamed protein product [Acanthoscelides obtectus]CAK1628649.1 Double-stranded RNA-binding protein Staufen homolog 2 [Acanthoscelides obtectus]
MDYDACQELLMLVKPLIEKKNTLFREAVSVEERLLATLRFLATGRSYEDLKFSCIISPQLLGRIIPEKCRAIYNCLRKKYLCFPSKEEEWLKVAEGFNNMWQFENCLGAVDGKHIAIKQPPGSGSYYYNYKGFFSVVLFAIVNANYEFTYVSCGTNGRISDGGVIKKTDFYNLLITDSLKLPQPVNMRGIQNKLPFVFIGDEAFSLLTNFMTPYRQTNSIGYEEKCFNYRLCRARRVVENAFGIMANRFRIFLTPIATKVDTVDDIVMACCVLHNFLRRKSTSYIQPSNIDTEDIISGTVLIGDMHMNGELISLDVSRQGSPTIDAKMIRNGYKEYYNNAEQNDGSLNSSVDSAGQMQNEVKRSADLLSPITLVYNIAVKRNLNVTFEVLNEKGPPHMKVFVTQCRVGNFVADGEGYGKKISKKRAAEKMLEELFKLPPLPADKDIAQPKRKRVPIKMKTRNLIKVNVDNSENVEEINPIAQLVQIQQANREREPVYTVLEERGAPRRREFVIKASVNGHSCTGVGPNKKTAKRNAAEALLVELGHSTNTSNKKQCCPKTDKVR